MPAAAARSIGANEREIIAAARALAFVHNRAAPFPYPTDDAVALELRRCVNDADTAPSRWDHAHDRDASPLETRWQGFVEALQMDAGAKLQKG